MYCNFASNFVCMSHSNSTRLWDECSQSRCTVKKRPRPSLTEYETDWCWFSQQVVTTHLDIMIFTRCKNKKYWFKPCWIWKRVDVASVGLASKAICYQPHPGDFPCTVPVTITILRPLTNLQQKPTNLNCEKPININCGRLAFFLGLARQISSWWWGKDQVWPHKSLK